MSRSNITIYDLRVQPPPYNGRNSRLFVVVQRARGQGSTPFFAVTHAQPQHTMNKKNQEANGTQTAALSHEAETKQQEQTTTATEIRHDRPAVQISRAAIADMIAAIADIRSTYKSGDPADLYRAIERAIGMALDFGIMLE